MFRALRAIVLSVVVLTVAGSVHPAAATPADHEYTVGILEPGSLIPPSIVEVNGTEVAYALFKGLVEYDPWDSKPRNAVANRIQSSDQRVWLIELKRGWRFHDGTPVTARSFVDAWNYTAYAPNKQPNSFYLQDIEGYDKLQCETDENGDCVTKPEATRLSGLRVLGPHLMRVTLTAPQSQFPTMLGAAAFMPLPRAFFADPKAFGEAPIGNGPFRMAGKWEHHTKIRVVRNKDYPGPRPKATAVEFRIYPDVGPAYEDAKAGRLDVLDNIPPGKMSTVGEEFGERFTMRPSSGENHIGFPEYLPQFRNPDLRRAISMAIDREAIIRDILPMEIPAKSLVAPVMPGARPDPCGEVCTFNPERARELFQKAGGFNGPIPLWFGPGSGHEEWLPALAGSIERTLGVDVTLETAPDFMKRLSGHQLTGTYRIGWAMDYPSAVNFLAPMFATGSAYNFAGYSNPRVDQLIQQGNAAPGLEESFKFYHQAEDLILADLPHIPLFFRRSGLVHSTCVSNVLIDAFLRVDHTMVDIKRGCRR